MSCGKRREIVAFVVSDGLNGLPHAAGVVVAEVSLSPYFCFALMFPFLKFVLATLWASLSPFMKIVSHSFSRIYTSLLSLVYDLGMV